MNDPWQSLSRWLLRIGWLFAYGTLALASWDVNAGLFWFAVVMMVAGIPVVWRMTR